MNWWARNLPARMDEFLGWLGGPDAPSRATARELIRTYNPKSILDVGCGPAVEAGSWSDIEWAGCDSCEVLIQRAARSGVAVDYADAEALPYPAGFFDVVYARHLWEHLPTYERALEQALLVASRLVVHVFFRPPVEHGTVDRKIDGEYENIYSRAAIERTVESLEPGSRISWHPVGNETILIIEKREAA